MYEYEAQVLRVVDGDTVDCTVDLGMDVQIYQRLRLVGIDAPEINTAGTEGEDARDWLRKYLVPGDTIIVKTVKDRREKYGRYLASITAAPREWEGELPIDISAEMIRAGHARPYNGGAR